MNEYVWFEYDLENGREGHLCGTFYKIGNDILEVERLNGLRVGWLERHEIIFRKVMELS